MVLNPGVWLCWDYGNATGNDHRALAFIETAGVVLNVVVLLCSPVVCAQPVLIQ